jgi:hypothetical protein
VTSIPSFRDKTALKVVVSLFFLLLKLCHWIWNSLHKRRCFS